MACKFMRAWIGPCGKEGGCEHIGLMCKDHPSKPATHECDCAGSFVCGRYCCTDHYWCSIHDRKVIPDGK